MSLLVEFLFRRLAVQKIMVNHISSSLREGRNGNGKGGMGMRQVGTRMGSCCKHIVKQLWTQTGGWEWEKLQH